MDVKQLIHTQSNKVQTIVKDLLSKYHKRQQDKLDEKLLSSLLSQFSSEQQPIAEQILKNQINYCRLEQSAHPGQHNQQYVDLIIQGIVPRVIKQMLDAVGGLVGIQPLPSPVGMVYTLNHKKQLPTQDETPESSLSLEISSHAVTAITRRLHSMWSIEAHRDLHSVFGLDIEAELSKVLSAEITAEIVSEILDRIQTLAQMNPVKVIINNYQNFTEATKDLGIALSAQANDIAKTTRRGYGNYIITTPMGISLIQSMSHFNFQPCERDNPVQQTHTYANKHVGNIMSYDKILYRVYSSTRLTESDSGVIRFIVGYKGNNGEIDTGLIYSPYIPIIPSGIIVDSMTFQPVMTLMTRHGMHTITQSNDTNMSLSQNYYRIVDFDGALYDNLLDKTLLK